MSSVTMVLWIIVAYCVGSIPTGYLFAQRAGIDDIRKFGSGNIGATNVARLLGLHYFFIVLFFDGLKSFLFLLTCRFFLEEPFISLSAIALLIGNSYSLFLQGKGGKGVATAVGILLALHPTLFFLLIVTWISAFLYTKVVGIASVISLAILPAMASFLCDMYGLMLIIFLAAWITMRHKENIRSFYYTR